MYSLINKNFHHFFAILVFSLNYCFSLLIFGEVIIDPHDNLENIIVYDHIVSQLINGYKESLDIFLSGNFKWYYLDEVLYPINFFHLILDEKSFYFFEEILKKIFSYFSFYFLGKKLVKNKLYASIGAIVFASIINMGVAPVGYGLTLMPYLLYILIFKNLKVKYFLIIFIVGLNSSLPHDYLALSLLLPLAYFFRRNNKKILIFSYYFITLSVGIFLSNAMLFFHLYSGELIHRAAFNIRVNFLDSIKNIYNISKIELFYIFLILFSSIMKKKKLFFLLIFIFFTLILKIIVGSNFIETFFIGPFVFLKGLNLERLDRILPLLFSLLLIFNLHYLKHANYIKLLVVISLLNPIFLQILLPQKELIKLFLKNNFKQEKYLELENKEKFTNLKLIFDKSNYQDNLIFSFNSKNTFNGYYRFSEYAKIKAVVKNKRTMSIGLDPMVAAMNNIKVIDGYHTIYTLEYKKKFRKIISRELDEDIKLKNYYDNWGNRVYAFYNNSNDLLIDFVAAKSVGADYVISAFPIKNINLQAICLNCYNSEDIFLYKIL